MRSSSDVLVLGAGIAGLAAAARLAAAGRRVAVVEAQPRVGGRVHTVRDPASPYPIELGAEFVHGEPPGLWELIRSAGLTTVEVPGRHEPARGEPVPPPAAHDTLEDILASPAAAGADRPFGELLDERRRAGGDPAALDAAARYVQGFHAAELGRIGTRALAEAEAAGAEDGERQFRLADGYTALLRHLCARLDPALVELRLATVATEIRWRPGEVRLAVRTADGSATELAAERAVITLPLGVLRAADGAAGAVRLAPEIPEWRAALGAFEMGAAERVVLRFDEAWWADGGKMPVFLHGAGEPFPVWWTAAPLRAPLLTGWVGGPAALPLAGRAVDEVAGRALDSAARIFGVSRGGIERGLCAVYHHNWGADPFARGAYTYGGVGAAAARAVLSEPVAGTLVLAGEVLSPGGRNGTVQGALASGHAAAERLGARGRRPAG